MHTTEPKFKVGDRVLVDYREGYDKNNKFTKYSDDDQIMVVLAVLEIGPSYYEYHLIPEDELHPEYVIYKKEAS